MKVTAGYTQKINHALYGGGDYENSDHHCSLELETEDNPEDAFEELYDLCVDRVSRKIANKIASFGEGMSDVKFAEILRGYRLDNLQLNDSMTDEMTHSQKIILEEFKKLKRK